MRKHSLWMLLVLLLTASITVETAAATKARGRKRTQETKETETGSEAEKEPEAEPEPEPGTGEKEKEPEDYADAEAFLEAVYGLWFDSTEETQEYDGERDERIFYAESCLEALAPYRDAAFADEELTKTAQLLFAGLSTTASADLFADDPALAEALIDAGTRANLAATSRLCSEYGLELKGAETFIDAYLRQAKALYEKTEGGEDPKTNAAGDGDDSGEIPGKPDRNGFSEETNTTLEMSGVRFSIPDYFEPAENAGDDMIALLAEEDAVMFGIVPYDMGDGEDPETAAMLASLGSYAVDLMAQEIIGEMTDSYEDAEVVLEEAVAFGGFEGKMLTIRATEPGRGKADIDVVLLLKDTNFLMVVMQQNADSEYEYTPDLVRILESMETAE